MESNKYIQLMLTKLSDPRREAILRYHQVMKPFMASAPGSTGNHQDWPGGYADHIAECLRIAKTMYYTLKAIRPLPFKFDSVVIALYFHDIGKIFRDKGDVDIFTSGYVKECLPQYDIHLTNEEMNAIKYAHGEGEDYSKSYRVMNELAAFVHSADCLSARMWHDKPGIIVEVLEEASVC